MALLDHIEVAGFTASYTVWENGLRGAICDIDHDCIYRFVEVTEDGAYYKYKESEWKEKCPIVAVGIIAWWFKYRRTQEGIASIYESYYQMRLGVTVSNLFVFTRLKVLHSVASCRTMSHLCPQ